MRGIHFSKRSKARCSLPGVASDRCCSAMSCFISPSTVDATSSERRVSASAPSGAFSIFAFAHYVRKADTACARQTCSLVHLALGTGSLARAIFAELVLRTAQHGDVYVRCVLVFKRQSTMSLGTISKCGGILKPRAQRTWRQAKKSRRAGSSGASKGTSASTKAGAFCIFKRTSL